MMGWSKRRFVALSSCPFLLFKSLLVLFFISVQGSFNSSLTYKPFIFGWSTTSVFTVCLYCTRRPASRCQQHMTFFFFYGLRLNSHVYGLFVQRGKVKLPLPKDFSKSFVCTACFKQALHSGVFTTITKPRRRAPSTSELLFLSKLQYSL